ncbi:MAG: glycosyltransferase [Lachnospiraceae bacterium]|nr:glycosyltransferase [Lachnospiraceae bacterium]
MKLTSISNYINHHQIPVSNVYYEHLGDDYHFIEMEPMEEERIKQGWNPNTAVIPFVKSYYKEPELCQRIIDESDVVIFGGVEDETCLETRIAQKKIIIRYSERLYREGQWKCITPRGLIDKYKKYTRHNKDNFMCILCSGAYVASDFNIVRAFPGKRYKWGYFTEFLPMEEPKRQSKEVIEFLWAGRFMKLKGGKQAVEMIYNLKKKGLNVHLTMVGDGECKEELHAQAERLNLKENVGFTGFLTPEEVRKKMIESDIFLFTSNYLEGWGAVLTEAMNSKCAVISSHAVGAAPFLIEDGVNGMIYKNGSVKELTECAQTLVSDEALRRKMGEEAYKTIRDYWNPRTAAERVLALAEEMLLGQSHFEEKGPLSEAQVIAPAKMYGMVKKGKKI